MRWWTIAPLLMAASLPVSAGAAEWGNYKTVNPNEREQVHDACNAKAKSLGMDIRTWNGIREVTQGRFEADVVVEYKGSPYQRVCRFNIASKDVDFSENPGQSNAAENANERVVRERARQACEAKASAQKIEVLRWGPFTESRPDVWESDIRVRWKGQDYDRTCVYKDKGENVDIRDRK